MSDLHAPFLAAIVDGGQEPTEDIKKLFPDTPKHIPEKIVSVDNWQKTACEVMTVITKADGIEDEKEKAKAKKEALRKAFTRGLTKLEKDGFIGLLGDFVWLAYVDF